MENTKDLLEIVDEQKKTIEKYSNKLRDVVAAHKSLLIEKKALEDTFKILNKDNSIKIKNDVPYSENKNEIKKSNISLDSLCESDLKNQLETLLNAFSNLVAEKSHMEDCYKLNQKQLVDEKEVAEQKCKELQDQVKMLIKELKCVENKTPLDYGDLKKDLKINIKGMARNSKQQNEDNLVGNNKILENENFAFQVKNYEKEIKTLRSEIEERKLSQELSKKKLQDLTAELYKLQEEIRNMQIEHQMALQEEKEKTRNAEETAKKLTAVREERVLNLESKLAELSEYIGSYDRLRLQDQTEIQKLKEHIVFIDDSNKGQALEHKNIDLTNLNDYDSIVKTILNLKNSLEIAAKKCGREDDFNNLFPQDPNSCLNVHSSCKEEYNKLKVEFDCFKTEVKLLNNQSKTGKEAVLLQNQIKNLQEKVRILSEKNKEIEKEYQMKIEQLKLTVKFERKKFKDALAASEADYRGKFWLMEEQLQKQRERSLALLEEKEQEIHSLQSTFQMFLPGLKNSGNEEGYDSNVLPENQFVNGPHIVHYANELARKDIEISSLRKAKYETELALRDCQKKLVANMEKYKEEKEVLDEKILRLERSKTREGANLEYLKNVVFNFLLSSDPQSKRHMCNAIAAVLKFSESEFQKVISHRENSWWSR